MTLPILFEMILKHREIDYKFFAAEALKKCPRHTNKAFFEGFNKFSTLFFQNLNLGLMFFLVEVGTSDVDLDFIIEKTIEDFQRALEGLENLNKSDFCEGSYSSVPHLLEMAQLLSLEAEKT